MSGLAIDEGQERIGDPENEGNLRQIRYKNQRYSRRSHPDMMVEKLYQEGEEYGGSMIEMPS
jgi:hypothetical protein